MAGVPTAPGPGHEMNAGEEWRIFRADGAWWVSSGDSCEETFGPLVLGDTGEDNPWALVLDWFFIADEAKRRLAELDQVRSDVRMVLTVYDDHVEPENRGPWRDRLYAWATPPVETVELPEAVEPGEECPTCGSGSRQETWGPQCSFDGRFDPWHTPAGGTV